MLKNKKRNQLYTLAFFFGIITIVYNIGEGIVSTIFGITDETITLLGFGVDSFVEVLSGFAIVHMIIRLKTTDIDRHDKFERKALYITGFAFYILMISLIAGSVYSIVTNSKPETTVMGVLIAIASIMTMWILFRLKLATGKELRSDPVIADAYCTKTCFYLSFVLLISSIIYELFAVSYVDAIGGLAIAWFAFREGRETIEKARLNKVTCSCSTEYTGS